MEPLHLDATEMSKDVEPKEAFPAFYSAAGSPRRELKEQDLLRRLEENTSENSDCTVDCTLKLGFSSEITSQSSKKNHKTQIEEKNIHGGAAQVVEDYRMTNGGYGLYNRWGNVSGPSQINWLPMGIGGGRDGAGYYGSSSMAFPGPAAIFNRDYYARFSALAKQQQSNTVSVGRLFPGKPNGGYMDCVRRCSKCETTTTPLWRNGPKGSKSLCNACGIRYKKEERRAKGISDPHNKPKGGSVPSEPESSKKTKY